MAFFLEATFVGLFFFGWDRLSKRGTWWSPGWWPGVQLLGAVDPDRQWLDAEPGRRGLQSRHHAHGDHRLHRGDLQPGGAGQVRPHRRPAMCHRLGVRAGDLGLVPAAGRHVDFAKRSMTVAAASAWRRRCRWSCWATRAAMPPPSTRR
jgi:cytochrome d ubiquinol oxidase subunit I